MTSTDARILFAARRTTQSGTPEIILVDVKNGERFLVMEKSLRDTHACNLGDFLKFEDDGLHKMNYLRTVVEGDVAYVPNISAQLVIKDGHKVFQSVLFGDAIPKKSLPEGKFEIRISALPEPKKLLSDMIIHFESDQEAPTRINTPINTLPFLLANRASPTNSAARINTPNSTIPLIPLTRASPINSATGNIPLTGAGFSVEQPVKNKEGVVGKGFESSAPKPVSLRAVVLSVSEKNGWRTHYLWILDRQAEGRFSSKTAKLERGHFFQGLFTRNKDGKFNTQKYLKGIETPLAEGGISSDNNKIFFKVKIDQFKAAGGNRRFGTANAKYFGEILEGESESLKFSSCSNGKTIKIQRLGISENEYAWRVIEIF